MGNIITAAKKAASAFKAELQSELDDRIDHQMEDINAIVNSKSSDEDCDPITSDNVICDNENMDAGQCCKTDTANSALTTPDQTKMVNISHDNAQNVSTTLVDDNTSTSVVDDTPQDKEEQNTKQTEQDIVRRNTCISTDEWQITGLSLRGRAHIKDGSECQDYHQVEVLDSQNGWIINVVSDGAGSAKQSARGSQANCELVCQMLRMLIAEKKWIENNYFPSDKEWYAECYSIFSMIQSVIVENAKKESCQPREFNATLLVLLTTPNGLLIAHVGDGRMGYQTKDGCWHTAINPHKGDEANQTVFIPNQWNRISIPAIRMSEVLLPETIVVDNCEIIAFVIMSDGCEHAMWICHQYDKEKDKYIDKNIPGAKFLDPLLTDIKPFSGNEKIQRLKFIMREGTPVCMRETDDQTIIIGQKI